MMAEEPTTEKQSTSQQHRGSRSSLMPNIPAVQPQSNTYPPGAHPQVSVSASSVEDFKCNICLNIASDAVLTLCGHLFCWPCLYTWLHYHSKYKECPVCKGAASETRLIPVYSWGAPASKDAGSNSSKLPNNTNIPPRPPAKRIESERQRRHRHHAQRERRSTDQNTSEINNATMNQVLFALNESASSRDAHSLNNNNTIANSRNNTNNTSNASLEGRETRASWLERLRAMREERLAWPVAFVRGLTSRELLQQRRQASELMLSPRLVNGAQDCPMIDPNINISASYCHSRQTQPGALQGALSLDGNLRHLGHNQVLHTSSLGTANASHTSQYLSTMSSILSSMEVFAKALELSSASSLSKHSATSSIHTPAMRHHLRVFNVPNEEQNLWQSSMHGLLSQMERLMVQLQSIQPMASSTTPTPHLHMLQNHWINGANVAVMPTNTTQPYHHHHHHHYHVDGSLTDRSHMMNPLMDRSLFGEAGDARTNAINANHILGLSPRLGARSDPNANMGHRGLQSSVPFSLHSHGSGSSGGELQQSKTSKSRKRWDVTRMST